MDSLHTLFSSYPSIEKKIHVTFKNKDIIDKDYILIKNGILQLKLLNPDYEFKIYDNDDIENYLQSNLSLEDYELIKNKKIVEKTDLWRLFIIYNEGGIYQDIDRYCNIPLSNIIKDNTKCILPMNIDSYFSQDIMISCSKNIVHKTAIDLILERRRMNPNKDLFFLGPITYFHAVSKVLLGRMVNSPPNKRDLNLLRDTIEKSPYLETFREQPPFNTILYQGPKLENDKEKMYSDSNVKHWSLG